MDTELTHLAQRLRTDLQAAHAVRPGDSTRQIVEATTDLLIATAETLLEVITHLEADNGRG